MHKAALRQQLLQKRLAMPEAAWRTESEQLVEQILLWLQGKSFQHYILYRSFRREPSLDTLASILPVECTFYPRVEGEALNFYRTPTHFVRNRYGIEEAPADPRHRLETLGPETLLIIPAVAYDERGYRLGYGGGFFDRYLAQHRPSTLGVCFDAFLLPLLPIDPHDQPVEAVITERRALTGIS